MWAFACSRNFGVSFVIHGIMQHPLAVNSPVLITKVVRTKTINPFHFLNYSLSQSINGSILSEFSANSLTRVLYERSWELWLQEQYYWEQMCNTFWEWYIILVDTEYRIIAIYPFDIRDIQYAGTSSTIPQWVKGSILMSQEAERVIHLPSGELRNSGGPTPGRKDSGQSHFPGRLVLKHDQHEFYSGWVFVPFKEKILLLEPWDIMLCKHDNHCHWAQVP